MGEVPSGCAGYERAPSTSVTHSRSFARRAFAPVASIVLGCAAFAGGTLVRTMSAQGSTSARAAAPAVPALPFGIGEALKYQVRVARMGDVGTGRMWIEGPLLEQGVTVWRLRSEINAGKGPIRATDRTSSWFDPSRFAIVRFQKAERHLLSNSEEHVTIDRAAHRWRDEDGPSGALGSDLPLDELSFLYFLRTIPLDGDSVMRFDRHFDAARNPTIIRIKGEETLTTPAGIFRTRVIEMEVRDPKRYKGTGKIRIHLYAEECRIPIRIESRMPVLGITTLTLTGWTHSPQYPTALPCG